MARREKNRPGIFPRGMTIALIVGIVALIAVLVWIGLRSVGSPVFYAVLAALVVAPPLVFSVAARRALPRLHELDRESEEDDDGPYPEVPEHLKNHPHDKKEDIT